MNPFDTIVVVLMVIAAVGGWRLGFVARAASWFGMGVGTVVAARLLPSVIELVDGPNPTGRLFVAIGFLLAGAFLGQAVGLVVGSRLHLAIPIGPARLVDRSGGAVAGVLGVLVAVWLLLPTMAEVPGTFSRLSRNSAVAQAIDRHAPQPPDTLQTLNRLVGETDFPRVFSALRPAPDAGPPPADIGLSPEVVATVTAATVRVEGEACGRIQEGSGFVAQPGVVVTNAHVVAGEDQTELVTPDGDRVDADVVFFDPDRDLAVLRAPDLDADPLPIGDADVGATGAVFGYPGGGPLELSPFRVSEEVRAVGRDLYNRHDTERQVFVLSSDLAPGDSGAPLVDAAGSVVGVAFAIAPDRAGIAYALTTDELGAALAAPRGDAPTGPCLRG